MISKGMAKTKFGLLMLGVFFSIMGSAQQRIIVDADTGNEVDDLYALVRILMEPSVEVVALNAAHWQTAHWAIENTMENSHRLNQQILGEMGLSIKTNRGGAARMYDWGDRAQHSAAAYEIIEQAQAQPGGTRLPILVLGALTNVASALFLEPSISSKIEVYWLGTTMDFETKILKRNDFNCAMDQFALDYMLESNTPMNIMPVSVAFAMEIDYKTISDKIGSHYLGNYLIKRWDDHLDGSRRKRVLWDLALVTSFIKPSVATTTQIKTSRDSGNRIVNYYDSINAKDIYEDFYENLLNFK